MGKPDLSDKPIGQVLKYYWSCPPHGWIARMQLLLLVTLLIYGSTWAITGGMALPGGNFFGIFTLVVLAVVSSWFVGFVTFDKLPPLLGELVIYFTCCYKILFVHLQLKYTCFPCFFGLSFVQRFVV